MTVSRAIVNRLAGWGVVVGVLVPMVTGCASPVSQPASSVPTASSLPTVSSFPTGQSVAPIFRAVLPQLEAETEIPILLPGHVPLPEGEVHADAEATSHEYAVHLGYTPGCRGTACFVGLFAARRTEGAYHGGEELEETVRLANGIEGYFNPVRCAASCGPAVVEWTQDGVRYRFALKAFSTDAEPEKQAMIGLASSAITAGDRTAHRGQENSRRGDAPF